MTLVLITWGREGEGMTDEGFDETPLEGNCASNCPSNRLPSCRGLLNVTQLISVSIGRSLWTGECVDCGDIEERWKVVLMGVQFGSKIED
jgi:hypothetical protein